MPTAKKKAVSALQRKASPRKARAYHKGHVAQDLLAAAAKILKEERVEDVSVRRLAREVGVTPANFYNHFPSLDDLLLTLAAQGFDDVSRDSARVMTRAKTRRDGLLQLAVQFAEFAMANKQLFRIMFGQIPNSTAHTRFKEASDASFGQLIRHVYGRDLYDPTTPMETHQRGKAAYALFALAYGLARNIIEDQFLFETNSRAEIRHFVEEVMGTLLDGTVPAELGT
jgi:AcrR family transcriptional regulator